MTSSITGLNDLFRQLSQQASSLGATGAGAAGAAQFLQGAGQDLPPPSPLDGGDDDAQSPAAGVAASPLPSQKFSAGVLQILLSAQTTSTAQPTSADLARSLIRDLDQNSDGSLSLSEVQKALQSRNGPSAVDQSADAASKDPLAQAFASLDTDGDGQLSAAELTAGLDKLAQDETATTTNSPHRRHHHHPVAATGPADPSSASGAASATTAGTSPSSGDVGSALVAAVTLSASGSA